MAEIVVPFRIAAADVNLLDGTTVELANIGVADELVRVPTRIELWREAGTAYTLDKFADVGFKNIFEHTSTYANLPQARRGPYLVVRQITNDTRPSTDIAIHTVFNIDASRILEKAEANGMIVFPEGGLSFPTGVCKLTIACNCAISGGTGDLVGRIYFDEYPTK